MELTTIKTFDNSIEVHLLKVQLENEGIECFVFDENIVTANPMYSYAVGGIKLKVRTSDIEQVRVILDKMDKIPYTDQGGEAIKCPRCQSTHIDGNVRAVNDFKSAIALVTSFICNVIPFYTNSVYKCKKCNYEFKRDKNQNF